MFLFPESSVSYIFSAYCSLLVDVLCFLEGENPIIFSAKISLIMYLLIVSLDAPFRFIWHDNEVCSNQIL